LFSKSFSIDVFLLIPEGMIPMFDWQIFGKISCFKTVNLHSQNFIVFLTEKYQLLILGYDEVLHSVYTKGSGYVKDIVASPSETGHFMCIDSYSRMIALHVCSGLIKIILFDDKGKISETVNMRLYYF
jgi:hypothetical protein